MLVEIAPEVFIGDGSLVPIIKMIGCFTDGRHDWSADPDALAAAERYFETYTPMTSSAYLDLGRKGLVAASWRQPGTTALVRITLNDLADAAEDLCRPAVLIVEDLRSDGCFVRSIATVFRADHLLKALSSGWLVIGHGAGERLAMVAEEERRRFRCKVRVVALLDSDRLRPLERTKAHQKADYLQTLSVLVHVLELREAENYVPNRVLSTTKDARRKLQYVKRLSLTQRGHYDMKNGFRQKNGTFAIHGEQRELFDGLDDEIVQALGNGFGQDLLATLERQCGSLTEEDFSKLGPEVADELRKLLSMISGVV